MDMESLERGHLSCYAQGFWLPGWGDQQCRSLGRTLGCAPHLRHRWKARIELCNPGFLPRAELAPTRARMQLDEDVKAIVALLVRCAFGRPAEPGARIPGRCAAVEVAIREAAFNPLSPPSSPQPRDETIYVAFQQRVAFEVGRAAPVCWLGFSQGFYGCVRGGGRSRLRL